MDCYSRSSVGNDPVSCIPVVFPEAALTRTGLTCCQDVMMIIGPAGHGAAPTVYRAGPHLAAVTPDQLGVQ